MIRNLILLFGAVVTALLGLTAYHVASVSTMAEQPVPVYHWADTSGSATVGDAMRANAYEPVRKRRVNFGYTESVHWFRFRLRAGSLPDRRNAGPPELSFEIRNHTIDRLTLFSVTNGVVTSLGETGSRYPFAQRPSPTKTFVYLLNPDTGQPTDYYLRLDKRYENLATELTLWQTNDFEDKEQREYFLWGLFGGVVGLVVLLAFLFYAATRDRDAGSPVYGWYGLYVLALAGRQFADTGLGFQYLWPRLPAINHPDAVIMALWLYIPAMLQFQQHFLQLRTESKPVFRVTQVFKYAFWGLFIGLVISQAAGLTETYTGAYRLVTQIHTWMANGAFLVFPVVVVVGLRSPDTVKRLYAAGFGVQIACQLFIFAQNLTRYRPDGVFFVDAYLILMVIFFIDLVIFSYLLAYRYRKSVDDQRQLQVNLIQTQQHTNEAVIDVLESERQQVGSLLLTDVAGRLTNTRTLLSALAPSLLLTQAVDLIGKTDAALDQILRDSLPPDLTQKGLPTALAELVQQCCQSGTVRLSFSHDGHPPNLSATQTRQLYRIVNELITNIVKHAKATEGQVSLCQTPAGQQLTVADNGQGFDVVSARMVGGIGLKNLYARAQTLGATVQLDSGPTGTTVSLLLSQKIQTS